MKKAWGTNYIECNMSAIPGLLKYFCGGEVIYLNMDTKNRRQFDITLEDQTPEVLFRPNHFGRRPLQQLVITEKRLKAGFKPKARPVVPSRLG